MTGKVVAEYSSVTVSASVTSVQNGTLVSDASHQYSAVEVATAVTFTVAVIQVKLHRTLAQFNSKYRRFFVFTFLRDWTTVFLVPFLNNFFVKYSLYLSPVRHIMHKMFIIYLSLFVPHTHAPVYFNYCSLSSLLRSHTYTFRSLGPFRHSKSLV